ncbi:MAG TPA: MazG nucleotide pyrophosphohydrolase domain-containing protein [Caldisericia bacterium]|nr:MazG nucleotide pyrophosphohydrolase domain-containing protein [Caldisericia bacterium]
MNFSWIIEKELMISSAPENIQMLSRLRDTGIKAVVSLSQLPFTDKDFEDLGLFNLKLQIPEDKPPTLEQLREFIFWAGFMKKHGLPLLIHCQEGYERSATLAACYLVIFENMTANQAIEEVRAIRGDNSVAFLHNQGFVNECEYVKPLLTNTSDISFYEAKLLIDLLRRHCPWDREQTPNSMMQNLLEETYEVWEAVKQKDMAHIKEELGDILLQVLMVSRMLSEEQSFSVEDVIATMQEKLVYRHPHVFGESKTKTVDSVLDQWNSLKKQNKNNGSIRDIPSNLPPLGRAERKWLMQRASGSTGTKPKGSWKNWMKKSKSSKKPSRPKTRARLKTNLETFFLFY